MCVCVCVRVCEWVRECVGVFVACIYVCLHVMYICTWSRVLKSTQKTGMGGGEDADMSLTLYTGILPYYRGIQLYFTVFHCAVLRCVASYLVV